MIIIILMWLQPNQIPVNLIIFWSTIQTQKVNKIKRTQLSGCLVLWLRVRFTRTHNFYLLVMLLPQFFNDGFHHLLWHSCRLQEAAKSCFLWWENGWTVEMLLCSCLKINAIQCFCCWGLEPAHGSPKYLVFFL